TSSMPIASAPQASDRSSIGARKPPPPISVTFIDVDPRTRVRQPSQKYRVREASGRPYLADMSSSNRLGDAVRTGGDGARDRLTILAGTGQNVIGLGVFVIASFG